MSRIKTLVCLAVASALQVFSSAPGAQELGEVPNRVLLDAVRKSVANNPEVQASWHGYESATAGQKVAAGGFFPRLDLNAAVGHEWYKERHHERDDWTYTGAGLELNQMIWDGFATASEVKRMGFTRLMRYYQLLESSENTTLETVRAYADVLRQRELVEFAKANYVAHKQIADRLNNRATAGISRKVDLDQAAARLALAESNLLTELSNLHDVSTRYQRLVGEVPPDVLTPLAENFTNVKLPEDVVSALRVAYVNNPSFNAAIENVRAGVASRNVARSNYHPRLDLRARTGINNRGKNDYDYDKDGNRGDKGRETDSRVELVFNLNLFRGGSDAARVTQATKDLEQAKDLREKACRDLRQTLSVAYQDTKSLVEQEGYLKKHRDLTAVTRDAYYKQFDLGQRTLLDLLDSENEFFSSQRAYAIAQYDLLIAQARTLAGTGQLLRTLGVVREGLPTLAEAGQNGKLNRDTTDPADLCPADAPVQIEVDKAALVSARRN